MPNLVAIEYTDGRLLVACAKTSGRRFQINHLFEIDAPENPSAIEVGEELKQQLQQRGVTRADLIGVVHRRSSEMREVSVPPAPANELPDLVRFQARNVFASLNDSWLFDFVPCEIEGNKQRVLAMAIGPDIKTKFDELAEASGLTLKRILYRPYSIVELFDKQLDNDTNKVIVLPVDNRLDFVVAAGKRVAAARSIQSSGSDATPEAVVNQVVGELRRTIASTRSMLGGSGVDEVIIAGDSDSVADLQSVLKKSFELPVQVANPLGILNSSNFTADPIPDSTERFAALIGSLANEASGKKPVVDFLNPRRPVVKKRDFRKVGLVAAAIGILVVGAFAMRWYLLSEQESAIAKKKEELRVAIQNNKGKRGTNGQPGQPGVDEILGEVGALDKWYARKVNWLDEFVWISDKMLTPDDIRALRLHGTETRDGFRLTLDTKMTNERSSETSWKKLFNERYASEFGDVEPVDDDDFPIKRDFKLSRNADIDSTVEQVSLLVDEKLDAMNNADGQSVDDDLESVDPDEEDSQEAASE